MLREATSRRPPQSPLFKLDQRVISLEDLSEEDERSILHFLDAIDVKNKLKAIATEVE